MAKQTFTTGQVLTAAQMTSLQQTAMGGGSATAKTASYTLVAADAGATVIMNSASATTITVNTSLFSAGDTVFIQNLGAGVSTITPGTATVNTASSLALAQYESGNLYFTAAGASIFSKADGAAAAGGGKVLQVVSTNKDDTYTLTSTTYTDITGLSVSITPSLASSKIMVFVMLNYSGDIGAGSSQVRLMRDATAIAVGATAGNRTKVSSTDYPTDSGQFTTAPITILDTPATTSALTYKIQIKSNDATGTAYVNRAETDNDSAAFSRGFSSITVMEIGA